MKKRTVLYFAYASNMLDSELEKYGFKYLSKRNGYLEGYKLIFNIKSKYGGQFATANIKAKKGVRIYGVVYEITEDELKKLDAKEGVHLGQYERIKVRINYIGGSPVEDVITYRACEEFVKKNLLPSKKYIQIIVDGALNNKLPVYYIARLKKVKTAD